MTRQLENSNQTVSKTANSEYIYIHARLATKQHAASYLRMALRQSIPQFTFCPCSSFFLLDQSKTSSSVGAKQRSWWQIYGSQSPSFSSEKIPQHMQKDGRYWGNIDGVDERFQSEDESSPRSQCSNVHLLPALCRHHHHRRRCPRRRCYRHERCRLESPPAAVASGGGSRSLFARTTVRLESGSQSSMKRGHDFVTCFGTAGRVGVCCCLRSNGAAHFPREAPQLKKKKTATDQLEGLQNDSHLFLQPFLLWKP